MPFSNQLETAEHGLIPHASGHLCKYLAAIGMYCCTFKMCSILLVLETSAFALLSPLTTAARPATFLSPFETEPAPKILPKHTQPKHWVQ